MKQAYKTTRIWVQTLQNLKRIAAETGESVVALIDRLAAHEWRRVSDTKSDTKPIATKDTNP